MRPNKRLCRSVSLNPLYFHLQNVLDEATISILTNEAKTLSYNHPMEETKCFCFNACVKWDKTLKPQFIHQSSLLSDFEWNLLTSEVQNISLELIKYSGQQTNKISEKLTDKISWIAFELIRIPLDKKVTVPMLQWHKDPGYFDNLSNEKPYYADTTTIFMLTNPDSWKGGVLELQVNGIDRGDMPPIEKRDIEKIKYFHNSAVTFYNKDSRHRVTKIESQDGSQDRIIFTCSIYGENETKEYCKYYGIN
jgi:hypothetical protein